MSEERLILCTVIGGIRYADDYAVIWRDMSIRAARHPTSSNGPGMFASTAGHRPPTTAARATASACPDEGATTDPFRRFASSSKSARLVGWELPLKHLIVDKPS
jgi:hypothetical protein